MIFTIAQASSLGVGSRSDDVITLQKVLIKKGYLKIANPTNYFGSLTKNAVISFQKANKLTPNGIVDSKILNLLNSMNTVTKNNLILSPIVGCTSSSVPSITVLSPNGGETYSPGQQISVTWKSCNIPDKLVTIYIGYSNPDLPGKGWEQTLMKEPNYSTNNTGIETVTLPSEHDILSQGATGSLLGQHFKIKVSTNRVATCVSESCNIKEIYDYSDNLFKIGNQTIFPILDPSTSITVVSPNGGEVYTAGQPIVVKWKSNNILASAPINIMLLSTIPNPNDPSHPFSWSQTLLTGPDYTTLNDGIETLNLVPASTIAQKGQFGQFYKIVVSSGTFIGSFYDDRSDNLFTIDP